MSFVVYIYFVSTLLSQYDQDKVLRDCNNEEGDKVVMIKYLDQGPFVYHKDERIMPLQKDVDGFVMLDINGKPMREPREELPYSPAYILTDEKWLKDIIHKLTEEYPDKCDIHNAEEGYKAQKFLSCSIDKQFISFGT